MKIDLKQGSPEWVEFRKSGYCASEAPAMMGYDKYLTRNELLRFKKTGESKVYSDWVKRNVLDRGHKIEAIARTRINETTFRNFEPSVFYTEDHGIRLIASLDGYEQEYQSHLEIKTFNKSFEKWIDDFSPLDHEFFLPYIIQIQHQFIVSKTDQCIFSVSNENADHLFVIHPNISLIEKIITGWKQFDEDLSKFNEDNYLVPIDDFDDLPDNIEDIIDVLDRYIDDINLEPFDEEEYGELESSINVLKKARNAVDNAKYRLLSKESDRLLAFENKIIEKQEAAQKVMDEKKNELKIALVHQIEQEYDEFIKKNNLIKQDIDFKMFMKGKKTLDSIKNGIHTALAQAKVSARLKEQSTEQRYKKLKNLTVFQFQMLKQDMENFDKLLDEL